jgi:DNA-3-methyladenine glycosylase II
MHRPALKHLHGDAVMSRLIKEIGPPTLAPLRQATFASIARSIVHQQLSGRVAEVIFDRFKKLFSKKGERCPTPKEVLAMPVEKLRGIGLSNAKANAIRDLAQRTRDGLVPTLEQCDDLTDAQLVDALTAIKGVGPWTVEMLLIFNLGRPDVLPHNDLGVRKGFQVAHGLRQLPSPERVARDGKRWSPHRTLAAWYLWRAADAKKEKVKKK